MDSRNPIIMNTTPSRVSSAEPRGFLIKDKFDRGSCIFRSRDSVHLFLGIEEPYNACQIRVQGGSSSRLCARVINRKKKKTVISLIGDISRTAVPSLAVAQLLKELSPHVVCGKEKLHQPEANSVYEKWCTWLWRDYLRANGLDPECHKSQPAMSKSSWQDALNRALQKQQAISSDCQEDSETVCSEEDSESDHSYEDRTSSYATPDTTIADLSAVFSALSKLSTINSTEKANMKFVFDSFLSQLASGNVPGHHPNASVIPPKVDTLRAQRQEESQEQTREKSQKKQPQHRAFTVYHDAQPAKKDLPAVAPTFNQAHAVKPVALRTRDPNQAILSSTTQFTSPTVRRSPEVSQANAKTDAYPSAPVVKPLAKEVKCSAAPLDGARVSLHTSEEDTDDGHGDPSSCLRNEAEKRPAVENVKPVLNDLPGLELQHTEQTDNVVPASSDETVKEKTMLAAVPSAMPDHCQQGHAGQIDSGSTSGAAPEVDERDETREVRSDSQEDDGQEENKERSEDSKEDERQEDETKGQDGNGNEDGGDSSEKETTRNNTLGTPGLGDDSVAAGAVDIGSIALVSAVSPERSLVSVTATPSPNLLPTPLAVSLPPPNLQSVASFRPYAQPMDPLKLLQKLLVKMSQPVRHEQRHCGFIYAYMRASRPGFLKIGHVQNTKTLAAPLGQKQHAGKGQQRHHRYTQSTHPVDKRLAKWEADCREPVVKVFQAEILCPAVERIERLVHLTLQDYRRVQAPPCEPCRRRRLQQKPGHGGGGHHKEWFEIDDDVAKHVVNMWAQVANQPAYDSLGRLLPFWWEQADSDLLGLKKYKSTFGWLETVPNLVAEFRRQQLTECGVLD